MSECRVSEFQIGREKKCTTIASTQEREQEMRLYALDIVGAVVVVVAFVLVADVSL